MVSSIVLAFDGAHSSSKREIIKVMRLEICIQSTVAVKVHERRNGTYRMTQGYNNCKADCINDKKGQKHCFSPIGTTNCNNMVPDTLCREKVQ
jgi:hypothetical protein